MHPIEDELSESPYSCPMCGCQEVRYAAPMGAVFIACSCRACGWEYLITAEEAVPND